MGVIGVEKLTGFLIAAMQQQQGALGFAPGVLADSDDTARAIMALQCLDASENADPREMVRRFKTDRYFRTYEIEQKPSFSANCNALLALLGLGSPEKFLKEIENCLEFLLQSFEKGHFSDKWNSSPQYSLMLFCDVLLKLQRHHGRGNLDSLFSALTVTEQRVTAALIRIFAETLGNQDDNGSWFDSVEVTAYGALTIV